MYTYLSILPHIGHPYMSPHVHLCPTCTKVWTWPTSCTLPPAPTSTRTMSGPTRGVEGSTYPPPMLACGSAHSRP